MASEITLKPIEQSMQLLLDSRNSNITSITDNIQGIFDILVKQQVAISELTKQNLLYQEAAKQAAQQHQEILTQQKASNAMLLKQNEALNERVDLLAKDLKEARSEISQLKIDYNTFKVNYNEHQHVYTDTRPENGHNIHQCHTSAPIKKS